MIQTNQISGIDAVINHSAQRAGLVYSKIKKSKLGTEAFSASIAELKWPARPTESKGQGYRLIPDHGAAGELRGELPSGVLVSSASRHSRRRRDRALKPLLLMLQIGDAANAHWAFARHGEERYTIDRHG